MNPKSFFPPGYNCITFILGECYQQMKRVYHFDAVTWQRKVSWSKVCGMDLTRIPLQAPDMTVKR